MPIGTASRPITHAAQGTIGGATVSTMLIGFTTTNVKGDDPPFIQTVLAAHTKSKYPPVTIVPQRGHHEVAAAMGKDVLVESHAFNKKYRVIAKDVETAHAVLQPRVIERLLASDLPTAIAWDGNSIILTQKGLMGDSATLTPTSNCWGTSQSWCLASTRWSRGALLSCGARRRFGLRVSRAR